MKKVPMTVWLMALVLIGVLALVALTLTTQKSQFNDIKLPVQITEYFDYQCPHCAEFAPTINEVVQKYGDKVQITYSHYPFLSDASYTFAYTAEAAREQGKFQEFHDATFDLFNKVIAGTASSADYDPSKIAQSLGLDMTKLASDAASSTIQDRVRNLKSDGAKLGVTSTPTVLVYGKKVEVGTVNTATNTVEYKVFTDLIDQLVKKAEENTK